MRRPGILELLMATVTVASIALMVYTLRDRPWLIVIGGTLWLAIVGDPWKGSRDR